ncbi:hypothetical protein [Mycobacterium leprae]|uniref:hypothetical protein n=1 Tax=Mycobacterium leprae TaxID=1769 RepID=UPI0019550732|nr:hypothetical protein [Mycobacterium leprae]
MLADNFPLVATFTVVVDGSIWTCNLPAEPSIGGQMIETGTRLRRLGVWVQPKGSRKGE